MSWIPPFAIKAFNEAGIVCWDTHIIDCGHHAGEPLPALEHVANQNRIAFGYSDHD